MRARRRLPIGAEPQAGGLVHFRIWAPKCRRVNVVLHPGGASTPVAGPREVELAGEPGGYHAGTCEAAAGDRYLLRLDGGDTLIADPASRFQPEGPFGPSEIVDPDAFAWTDDAWTGVQAKGSVVYELHVGTFTEAGTWCRAARELPRLAALGVNVIEMLPVADFPGRFGWGYDGVNLFAPTRLYGRPDDLRAFINRAHALGVGVVLDVVYNHVGPSGASFDKLADEYFAPIDTDWGRSINFDGPGAEHVREFYLSNATYWIDEFHFDGLRLDATQSIADRSAEHIVAAIARGVRETAGRRTTWIVAENEPQDSRVVRAIETGGFGLDAVWNDDYHHTAVVALTGHREAYYMDYGGQPQEFVSAAKHGFLYQGQWYKWQSARRGQPALDVPAHRFVVFLENHDQVANSASGARLHQQVSPGKYRALTALTLLGPWTPMLFQGQEFAASSPFLFFADHEPSLATLVRRGRAEFLRQVPRLAQPVIQSHLADPAAASTFERCKLKQDEREAHEDVMALHADLLRLRRGDPTIAAQGAHGIDGAVLSAEAFLLRFFGAPGTAADRVLVVNLGPDLTLPVVPEPLLAPPPGQTWQVRWSSEAPAYGGLGVVHVEANPGWELPSESAVLLAP